MSAWGKLDNLSFVSGTTFTANLNSNVVTLSAPYFTAANTDPGDSLMLANLAYGIKYVQSANTILLNRLYSQPNTTGNVQIYVQQSPKWIRGSWGNTTGRYANTIGKRTVYGVDRVEANVAGNKANGFNAVGWVEYHTYTTTQGSVRHKVNPLVAMSKNFNANATGVLQTDANDNTILPNS
jgi:hypothetical protein